MVPIIKNLIKYTYVCIVECTFRRTNVNFVHFAHVNKPLEI